MTKPVLKKLPKKAVKRHTIIVDTNVIWCDDLKHPINPQVEQLLKKFGEQINLTLLIPEIVKRELLFFHTNAAITKLNRINASLSSLNDMIGTNLSVSLDDDVLISILNNRFNNWCSENKVSIINIPELKENEWKDIIDKSIRRLPPFRGEPGDKQGDKGFKDSVILLSIIQYCEKINGQKNDVVVAFITNDKILFDASAHELKNCNYLKTFSSLDEFESYINMTLLEHGDLYQKKIIEKTSNIFFDKGNMNSLYYKENIRDKLKSNVSKYVENPEMADESSVMFNDQTTHQQQYDFLDWMKKVNNIISPKSSLQWLEMPTEKPSPDIFKITGTSEISEYPSRSQSVGWHSQALSNISSQSMWGAIKPEKISIEKSRFEKIENEKEYFWKNKIMYEQEFAWKPIYNVEFNSIKTLKVQYDVSWSVEIRKNMSFYKPKYLSINEVSKSFKYGFEEIL